MTFKHDTVVRAWLDGKTIQREDHNAWHDVGHVSTRVTVPEFYVNENYRIKPEKIKARFFRFNNGTKWLVYSNDESLVRDAKGYIERQQGTWVGDWFDTPFDEE